MSLPTLSVFPLDYKQEIRSGSDPAQGINLQVGMLSFPESDHESLIASSGRIRPRAGDPKKKKKSGDTAGDQGDPRSKQTNDLLPQSVLT